MLSSRNSASPGYLLVGSLLALLMMGAPATALPDLPADTRATGASVVGCLDQQSVTSQCPDWMTIYAGPGGTVEADRLMELVLSPDERTTFVAGASWDDDDDAVDMTTIALDADSGEVRWADTRGGPFADNPTSMAVSPDGSVVYVGGEQHQYFDGWDTNSQSLVVAYDAATGEELWAATHGAPDELSRVSAIAVHPEGSTLYATIRSGTGSLKLDVVTLALDAQTGAEQWAARFNGPMEEEDPYGFSPADLDVASDIAVSPSGDQVIVSGWTYTGTNRASSLLLAYGASATDVGELQWMHTDEWDGAANWGRELELSPDGRTAYLVTEQGNEMYAHAGVWCCGQRSAFGITAHDTETGATLWRTTFTGAHDGLTPPQAAALSPAGAVLAVVGRAVGPGPLYAQAQALAVDTATGEVMWQVTHAVPGAYFTTWADVAFDGNGQRLFVTGHGLSQQLATVVTAAYDTTTGVQSWQATYTGDPTTTPTAYAISMAVTGDGQGVIIAGGVARTQAEADRGDHVVMRYGTG